MTKPVDDLKATLRQMSLNERAELAHLLISSLDDTVDADAETEWDKELAKRVKEIDEGNAHGRPAFEVLRDQ
jgi:Putative addiction module component